MSYIDLLPALRRSSGSNKFSNDEEHALMTGNVITCAISMLCSGAIVSSMLYLYFKSRRESPPSATLLDLLHFRLVFLLSLCDVLYSFGQVMGDPKDGSDLCYFQAIWTSFFELASLGWVLAIATTLWGTFVKKWPQDLSKPETEPFHNKLLTIYGALIFGVSLILTLLPLIDDNYGDSGAWCWIDDSDVGQAMRYLTFYMWLWMAIIAIFVMYYQLMNTLSEIIPDGQAEKGCCFNTCKMIKLMVSSESSDDVHVAPVRRVMRRLCLYPVVLIVCWTFATINRLQNSFDSNNPSIALFWLQMFFSNLNGFGNAMVYGFNASLQNDLKKYCCGVSDTTEREMPGGGGKVKNTTDLDFERQEDEISVSTDTEAAEPAGITRSQGRHMTPI